MQKKKIASLFLCIMLVISFVPVIAFAEPVGEIAITEEYFPDSVFREYVQQYDTNDNQRLSLDERNAVRNIYVNGKAISSLKGIEYFNAVEELYCSDTQIAELDVSNNAVLERLACSNTQILELDISKNVALVELGCENTPLTDLDVSKNTALAIIDCSNTKIAELDVSRNTALIELHCSDTPIKELDVSKNTALRYLICNNTQLTSLDVSYNSALSVMECRNNQIAELDVSNNKNLTSLYCDGTKISELNTKNNFELKSLFLGDTNISELNLSSNTKIETIACENTNIKELDLSLLPELDWLLASGCNLVSLKFSDSYDASDFHGKVDYRNQNANAVPKNKTEFDLFEWAPNIEPKRISNLQGANLEGTRLTGLVAGTKVTYTYDCGAGFNMDVVINVPKKDMPSSGGYVPPEVTPENPTVPSGDGYDVSLSKDGTTATITIQDGYEIVDVTVNGVSKGKVTEIENLKTGDKVEVTVTTQTAPIAPSGNERIINGVQNTKIWITKTSSGKGWIKLNYKKSKGYKVDYYEVFRKAGKNSKFGAEAFYKTTKNGLTGWYKNTKSLKKGTRYYYKVRGVRIIDGKKYYTQWSKTYYRIAK